MSRKRRKRQLKAKAVIVDKGPPFTPILDKPNRDPGLPCSMKGWAYSKPVEVRSDPFRITAIPPGAIWQAVLCADGKLRPMMVG